MVVTLDEIKEETKSKRGRGRTRKHKDAQAQEAARSTERVQFSLYPDEASRMRALCNEHDIKQSDLLRLLLANADQLLKQVIDADDPTEGIHRRVAMAHLYPGHLQGYVYP